MSEQESPRSTVPSGPRRRRTRWALAAGTAVALAVPLLPAVAVADGGGGTWKRLAARSEPGGRGEVTGSVPRRGLRVATFNVLGANHTGADGNYDGWPGYKWRMRRTVELLDTYRVSVAGLQEFQPKQQREFFDLTGDTWGISPDGMPVTGIVWRKSRWTLKRSGYITVPYIPNKPMKLPYVLLDPVGTYRKPVWFLNVHNPSNAWGDAAEKRETALRRELRLVRERLEGGPHPVVVTGDFNAREKAFCPMAAARLHASAGGSWSRRGGCRPPERPRIDWIFGTRGAPFSGHLLNTWPRAHGISDHPLILTVVRPPVRR